MLVRCRRLADVILICHWSNMSILQLSCSPSSKLYLHFLYCFKHVITFSEILRIKLFFNIVHLPISYKWLSLYTYPWLLHIDILWCNYIYKWRSTFVYCTQLITRYHTGWFGWDQWSHTGICGNKVSELILVLISMLVN